MAEPDPDIPPGEYFVNCIEYNDRVADLARDNPNGSVIGFHNQNGTNQRVCIPPHNNGLRKLTFESKWTFHPHHDRVFRNWKISTTTSNGTVSYARNNGTEV